MKRRLFCSILLIAPAYAQLERPLLTSIVDAEGSLRPVHGSAGAAFVGDVSAQGMLSMACSSHRCVVKTEGSLYWAKAGDPSKDEVGSKRSWTKKTAQVQEDEPQRPQVSSSAVLAPPGPALLAPSETETYIYFQDLHQFARWSQGILEYIDLAPEGDVLSLRPAGDGFDYAVAREGGTWIEHYSVLDGSVLTLAALGPTGAVMLMEGGGVLVASVESVRLTKPDAGNGADSGVVFGIPGAGRFTSVPGGYVQVNAASGNWLLRVDDAGPRVFLLPPPPRPPDRTEAGATETGITETKTAQTNTTETNTTGDAP